MLRQRGRAIAAAGVLAGLAGVATLIVGTQSSSATVPPGFYGVVPQTSLYKSDIDRMGTGKVGTLRTVIPWGAIDPTSALGDTDWATIDPIVLEGADNGIEVLPFIFGSPTWVAKGLDNNNCSSETCGGFAPKSEAALDAWATFVGEAVDRYGPDGEFWTLHPEVPKDPIDTWQIWNEQNSKTFYLPKPSPKGYAKLLAAASKAIDSRDPSADVVLGGMAELAGSSKAIPGSEYLAELYDVKGVTKSFDGVAPHPYGATIGKISSQVELYRKVMKQAGDSGAGLWVTEIGAGSASGGSSLNRGTQGQAVLLTDIYKYFLKQRSKMHIQTVDWFSWMDSKQSICSWCATSGLLKGNGNAKPSYKAFTKLTGGAP